MSRPSVTSVKDWMTLFESDSVQVESSEDDFFYRVSVPGKRVKYFYGENAWSDARRFAADIDFAAWSIEYQS